MDGLSCIIANSADGTDTRTISVTDTSQVTFSGAKMTINPTADLKANGSYTVTMGAGVVEDLVGNDFAGLSGTDLNFSTPGGGGGTEGQIFALTTSTDVIPGLIGSLGTTNTDGDDTIIGGSGSAGGSNTLGSADSINAGKGTDTLKFTSEGSGAAVSVTPNLTSVEKVFIQGLAMGGTVVNMVNATGTTEIWNERSTDAGGVLVDRPGAVGREPVGALDERGDLGPQVAEAAGAIDLAGAALHLDHAAHPLVALGADPGEEEALQREREDPPAALLEVLAEAVDLAAEREFLGGVVVDDGEAVVPHRRDPGPVVVEEVAPEAGEGLEERGAGVGGRHAAPGAGAAAVRGDGASRASAQAARLGNAQERSVTAPWRW